MQAVAAAFPEQKFGLVDVGPETLAPNIMSSVTKDWEGSFLVGYIAAKTTKTGTIGSSTAISTTWRRAAF